MTKPFDYARLMHKSMRFLIRDVMREIETGGLVGEHHFFINFATAHPRAQLADWLFDRYPENMTIVIQEWFQDLVVDNAGFAITLNFGDNPEPLYVPFDAIISFVDPSEEFGLRFDEPAADATDDAQPSEEPAPEAKIEHDTPPIDGDAEIVSLDQFRKK